MSNGMRHGLMWICVDFWALTTRKEDMKLISRKVSHILWALPGARGLKQANEGHIMPNMAPRIRHAALMN